MPGLRGGYAGGSRPDILMFRDLMVQRFLVSSLQTYFDLHRILFELTFKNWVTSHYPDFLFLQKNL